MSGARIDQINLVVSDVDAVARFFSGLGLDLPAVAPGEEAWASHHRTMRRATSLGSSHDLDEPVFEIELDSAAFARQWGGLDPSFSGAVINVRVDDRSEVDRLHELAQSIGGRSLKLPHDAFWGSRYAVVAGPASIVVGFISVPDAAHRSPPPDLESFA